jgi:hypothetical protein
LVAVAAVYQPVPIVVQGGHKPRVGAGVAKRAIEEEQIEEVDIAVRVQIAVVRMLFTITWTTESEGA